MQKPPFRSFTTKVELSREDLNKLLQGVADRAYAAGHRDGKAGIDADPKKVHISERTLCTIK